MAAFLRLLDRGSSWSVTLQGSRSETSWVTWSCQRAVLIVSFFEQFFATLCFINRYTLDQLTLDPRLAKVFVKSWRTVQIYTSALKK